VAVTGEVTGDSIHVESAKMAKAPSTKSDDRVPY
jgi:hypothetical protein